MSQHTPSNHPSGPMRLYQSTFPCETTVLCPLHAAAPALLAALEDLLDLGRAGFIRGEDIAVTRAVDAARAAITKAKGE